MFAIPTPPKLNRGPGRAQGGAAAGRGGENENADNAIALSAPPGEITAAVRAMVTGPRHLWVVDPGLVEGKIVFTYLDAFDGNNATPQELKALY